MPGSDAIIGLMGAAKAKTINGDQQQDKQREFHCVHEAKIQNLCV
jgi:hypothetical protein